MSKLLNILYLNNCQRLENDLGIYYASENSGCCQTERQLNEDERGCDTKHGIPALYRTKVSKDVCCNSLHFCLKDPLSPGHE